MNYLGIYVKPDIVEIYGTEESLKQLASMIQSALEQFPTAQHETFSTPQETDLRVGICPCSSPNPTFMRHSIAQSRPPSNYTKEQRRLLAQMASKIKSVDRGSKEESSFLEVYKQEVEDAEIHWRSVLQDMGVPEDNIKRALDELGLDTPTETNPTEPKLSPDDFKLTQEFFAGPIAPAPRYGFEAEEEHALQEYLRREKDSEAQSLTWRTDEQSPGTD
jgi:hypothetical protein